MSAAEGKNLCPQYLIVKQVALALEEDLSNLVDQTAVLIPSSQQISAMIKTNDDMLVAGVQWATTAFKLCSPDIQINWLVNDGDFVVANSILCEINGNARAVLTAERTALNFLQLLSATATTVSRYVAKVAGTNVKIMDTRKTIPGLRLAQKYAVQVGGGYNQRLGLYDGILIKENHIMACGGIKEAVNQAIKIAATSSISVQVEVESFAQLVEAVEAGAKLILLDNMPIELINKCVAYAKNRTELEVSGGIDLDNVAIYAKTGVDRISIGKLTKDLKAIDLSLRVNN